MHTCIHVCVYSFLNSGPNLHFSKFPSDVQIDFLQFIRVKFQEAFHLSAVSSRLSALYGSHNDSRKELFWQGQSVRRYCRKWLVITGRIYILLFHCIRHNTLIAFSMRRRVRILKTVIPASRKWRQKGSPVVSDETVMYGYEPSATLATDRLHYKLQTRPLVGEVLPKAKSEAIIRQKNGKRTIWSRAPKGCPTPR
jgi:hypothetical protein